ncbi:hypothetical protein EJ03DRAFT_84314 [Teratosphaeria nubilosa]|uniref:Uncharacterized protein n=1 Tax=Teratosphaeria nubilosa TaxID=161662 RepID=A0A6G1LC70_9PEZI|nr:hypothetical protein EJ03DRAFT_84314 [Teratosphaeria nubilosa]
MSNYHQGHDSVNAEDFANALATRSGSPNIEWSFESRRHSTRFRRGGSRARGDSSHHRSGLPDWPFEAALAQVAGGPPESVFRAAVYAGKTVILEGLEGAAEMKQSRASLHRRLAAAGEDLQGEAAPPVLLSNYASGDGAQKVVEWPTTSEMYDLEASDVVYGGYSGLSFGNYYTESPKPQQTQRPTPKNLDSNATASDPPAPIHEPEPGDRDRFDDFLKLFKVYYIRRHQSQHDRTSAIKAAVHEHLSLVPRGGYRGMGFTKKEEMWLKIAQEEEARIAAWAQERMVQEAKGRESWARIWDRKREQVRRDQEREERTVENLEKMASSVFR